MSKIAPLLRNYLHIAYRINIITSLYLLRRKRAREDKSNLKKRCNIEKIERSAIQKQPVAEAAMVMQEERTHLQGDPSGWLKPPFDLVPTVLAATAATYCPSRMAEHPKSKSTGGFNYLDGSSCIHNIWIMEAAGIQLRNRKDTLAIHFIFFSLDGLVVLKKWSFL